MFSPDGRAWRPSASWVNTHVAFDYARTRATKTALDVYTERVGVCRDFQHLAITFCRALNIPARYAAGYLGDIGIVLPPAPMDFSAWFEAWLGDRWWTLMPDTTSRALDACYGHRTRRGRCGDYDNLWPRQINRLYRGER